MAYVSVPKDLTVVKSKLVFNLTKRQLICFGLGAAVAVPSYLFVKKHIMTDVSVFLMIALAMPFFFLALYEKNRLPFERVALNTILVKFLTPSTRPYQTENFYRKLQDVIDNNDNSLSGHAKEPPVATGEKGDFIAHRQNTRTNPTAIQRKKEPTTKAEKE